MRRSLRAVLRIDRILLAVDDIVVDAVLDIGPALGVPKIRSLLVSFSVNSSGTSLAIQVTLAEFGVKRRRRDDRSSLRPRCNEGFGVSGHQVQVLRNQSVGST